MTRQRNIKTDLNGGKALIIMGHFDGHGGSQTAFRKLVEFSLKNGHKTRLIVISDHCENVLSVYDESIILGVIPHQTNSLTKTLRKLCNLVFTAIKAKFSDNDVFISVGLNNSANFIANSLNKSCYRLGQDFIANRQVDDKIWLESRRKFNGVALQAPAMLDYWKNVLGTINGLNWLPCFPEPPVNNIKHKTEHPSDSIKVAYFGRLAGNKGIDLLIKALSNISAGHNLYIDIWGHGDEEVKLKNLSASLGLTHRIKFMGGYPNGVDGAKLMAAYDCLALCSTGTEGLPLILLEAMAYGLPLLVTDVGAIRDCCNNNPDAILVQPNEQAVMDGLLEVRQRVMSGFFDPERQINYYKKFFSYSVMEERWIQCLQDPQSFFDNE